MLDAPAAIYLMVDADSVLQVYSHGYRNISEEQPVDQGSQFAIFSITKTFTAIAIMQLVEKQKIDLEQHVTHYLPEYPFLDGVHVRHLLAHQSGLNNPLPLSWIHLAEEEKKYDYQAFSHEVLSKKARLKRTPGKKAAYSNLNYLLLGEIIEKVSGQTYRDYITQNILKGNPGISFSWNEETAVTGYHKAGFQGWILGWLIDKDKFTLPKDNGYIPFKTTYLNGAAYGGLNATPEGLRKFLQGLLSDTDLPITARSMRQMWAEQPLNNEKPSGHSLGWFTGQLKGNRYVHHAGGGGGYYSELRVYPDLGIASFLLTNISGFSDQRLLDQLDAEAISNR